MDKLNIREADRVEVTILVDNYTDLLLTESTDICRRPLIPFPQILLAEHGLSCLIKILNSNFL
jgi:7,8-dihydropterin-6-yl-methyl-4-(beta-D-ribofuranosyl)aminobenzene 5'-phosphate synthase